MKKEWAILWIVTLAVIIVALAFNIFNSSGKEQIVGGDKDSHGCIGSAGYTWNETKQKCVREWEEINKTYCSPERKNATTCFTLYDPVCGYFNFSIQCVKYPCAQNYPNYCNACIDPQVEYYIYGECPK